MENYSINIPQDKINEILTDHKKVKQTVENGNIKSVNTIADLRKIKGISENDLIYVLAHNEKGLMELNGGGIFRATKIPEFTVTTKPKFNQSRDWRVNFSFTPSKRLLLKTTRLGAKLISNKGDVIGLITHSSATSVEDVQGVEMESNQIRGLLKGSTVFNKFVYCYQNNDNLFTDNPDVVTEQPTIEIGDEFHLIDDNGLTIHSDVSDYVFERIMPEDRYITADMFGANPCEHPSVFQFIQEADRIDCSLAFQKAFDNLQYSYKGNNGYYFCNDTLVVRVDKQYINPFGSFSIGNKRAAHTWSAMGCILMFTRNINGIEQAGASIERSSFNIDFTLAHNHDKNGYTCDLRNFERCRLRWCDINVIGSEQAMKASEQGGTNAFVIDDRDVQYRSKSENGSVTGTFHYSSINLRYQNVNKGFWITDTADRNTSTNGLICEMNGSLNAKQGIVMDRPMTNSSFNNQTWQMHGNLTWEQSRTLPHLKISGNRTTINGMFMDAARSPETNPIVKLGDIGDLELHEFINNIETSIEILNGGKRTHNMLLEYIKEGVTYWAGMPKRKPAYFGKGAEQMNTKDLWVFKSKAIFRNQYLMEVVTPGVKMMHAMESYFDRVTKKRIINPENLYSKTDELQKQIDELKSK